MFILPLYKSLSISRLKYIYSFLSFSLVYSSLFAQVKVSGKITDASKSPVTLALSIAGKGNVKVMVNERLVQLADQNKAEKQDTGNQDEKGRIH